VKVAKRAFPLTKHPHRNINFYIRSCLVRMFLLQRAVISGSTANNYSSHNPYEIPCLASTLPSTLGLFVAWRDQSK